MESIPEQVAAARDADFTDEQIRGILLAQKIRTDQIESALSAPNPLLSTNASFSLTRSDEPDIVFTRGTPMAVDNEDLVANSSSILFQYPKLILPLIIVWIAEVLLVFETIGYLNNNPALSAIAQVVVVIIAGCIVSILTCLGNVTLLKTLNNHFQTGKLSLWSGFIATLANNLVSLVIVAIVWEFISIIVSVVFETLRGFFSRGLARMAVDAGESVVDHSIELRVFAVLPAIAWENCGPKDAWNRSGHVIDATKSLYQQAYWQTYIINFILVLPLIIPYFYLRSGGSLSAITPIEWGILISYMALIWSFRVYTQQVVVAQLYLCSNAIDSLRKENPNSTEPITAENITLPTFFTDTRVVKEV